MSYPAITDAGRGEILKEIGAEAVAANSYNLDLKNPHAKVDLKHTDPRELVASIHAREQDAMRLLAEIESLVSET